MNVPPLAVYGEVAFRYDQIKRSFYFWFFQMQVSNAVVPSDDFAFIDNLWADWSPGHDASEDLPHAKNCLRDPANLQAAFGYYRDFSDPVRFGSPEEMEKQQAVLGRPLPQPTLYLHGTQDGCIGLDAETAQGVLRFVGTGSEVEMVEGVGHFMLVEKPADVNSRILKFLGKAQ